MRAHLIRSARSVLARRRPGDPADPHAARRLSGRLALAITLVLALAVQAFAPYQAEPARAQTAEIETGPTLLDGGADHSVAMEGGGQVWTWGDNTYGQLGDGSADGSAVPVDVDVADAVGIAAGSYHSLAVLEDGSVQAWGRNADGQLGNGSTDPSSEPVSVAGLGGIVETAGGSAHSLALADDGTVWAWGSNSSGQLGDGTTNSSPTPVAVQGLSDVVAIAAGGLPGSPGHSMALSADGTVWSWGENKEGQLGDGSRNNIRTAPVQVTALSGIVAIEAAGDNGYALASDGTVWAWGDNSRDQLGNPSAKRRSEDPVEVSISGVERIGAGDTHGLAVTEDGTAWAWGDNGDGQLGNSGAAASEQAPVQVEGLTDVREIAGGHAHSMAALLDGTAWAWGANANGQLGDGTDTDASTPVQAQGLRAVLAALEVSIGSPDSGADIDASEGWFEISGTALGGGAELAHAVVLADDQQIFSEPLWDGDESAWSITVTPPEPGEYDLEVFILDETGVQGSDRVDVAVTAVLEPEPEDEAILTPQTRVLDGALLAALAPVEYPAQELRFTVDDLPIAPGDVLVADVSDATPDGLLVRVLGIEQQGDEWVVEVAQAALADVFLYADIDMADVEPDGAAMQSFSTLDDPTLEHCETYDLDDSVTLVDKAGFSASLNVTDSHLQACLQATFRLDVDLDLFSWNPSGEVEHFEATAGATGSAQYGVSLDGKAANFETKFPTDPYSRRLPPLRFAVPAGPIVIPVVITNELKVQVEAKGSVEASFSTSMSGEVGFTTGLVYTAAGGWDDQAETFMNFDYQRPSFSGVEFDMRIGPRIMVDSKLYGVVGPRFQVYPALRGHATAFDGNVPYFKASLITSLGISAEFPKQLGDAAPDWSHTFAEPEITLWEAWLGDRVECGDDAADQWLSEGETVHLSGADDGTIGVCPGDSEAFSIGVSNASSLFLSSVLRDSAGDVAASNGGNGWVIENDGLDPDGYTLEVSGGEGDFTLHRYDHHYTDLVATFDGDTALYEIEVPGQLSFADVELTQGQMISLVGSGPRGNIWLTDPDGEDVGRSDTYRDHLAVTVEKTGTYRMRHEPVLNGTGLGSMTIWDRPEDPWATLDLTTDGDSVTHDLPIVGMKGHATFDGEAGDLITLMGSGPRAIVYLYGPDGQEVGRVDTYRDHLAIELGQTGTYTATYDPTIMDNTGEGTIQLWRRPEDPWGTLDVTHDGDSVALDMPIVGMKGHATFEGQAGDLITMTGSGPRAYVYLYGPDGEQIGHTDTYRDFLAVELEQSGTYTATYDPTIMDLAGVGEIQLWKRYPDPQVTFSPSAGGHEVVFDMPILGMRGHGTFSGSAGQQIRIEGDYTATDGPRGFVELYGPDGELIDRDDTYRGGLIEETLPASGTYTVTYDPTILLGTGSATVTVYNWFE